MISSINTMIPVPSPSYFDNLILWKFSGGRKIYRNEKGKRCFTWDSQHGEIEVFDQFGYHVGVMDPYGTYIKPAVPGRRIDVS